MKINHCVLLVLLQISLVLYGQSYTQADIYNYIDTYAGVAVAKMEQHGIPASITLAQGILESGAGQSDLAKYANNHFGIKCHSEWNGQTYHKDDDARNECFRKYKSPQESFEDHSQFLKKNRYADLFKLESTDYKAWAHGLKKAGYATNPLYAERLIKLIEDYNLSRFDVGNYQNDTLQVAENNRQENLKEPQKKQAEKREIFKKWTTQKPQHKPHLQQNADSQQEYQEWGVYQNLIPAEYPYTNRAVYQNNGLYFVVARTNDTYYNIAVDVQLGVGELKLYNEVPHRKYEPYPGEWVYLQRKHSKAENPSHIVRRDETIRSIAQQYGIRQNALRKLNNLSKDTVLVPGQKLRLQ
ncbi:MAG: glucosaminidase domain-containing protein [Bacteroidales bacterium]|nr:glucosaminidase domain-containing protein [Bacteroidales bacterium]